MGCLSEGTFNPGAVCCGMTDRENSKKAYHASESFTSVSGSNSPPFPSQNSHQQLKTCPRCAHLVKDRFKANIHSTLAYSRCRCHRTWKYYSEQQAMAGVATEQLRLFQMQTMIPDLQTREAPTLQNVKTHWNDTAKNNGGSRGKQPSDHLPSLVPTRGPRRFLARSNSTNTPPQLQMKGILLKNCRAPETCDVSPISSLKGVGNSCNNLFQTKLPALDNGRTHQQSTTTSSEVYLLQPSLEDSTHKLLQATSSPKNRLETSPKHSSVILPQVNSSSLTLLPLLPSQTSESKLKLTVRTSLSKHGRLPVSNRDTSAEALPQRHHHFELVHLVEHIPPDQRRKLNDIFTTLDQNGDGHLTFQEFLSGLPEQATQIEDFLKQFYHTLSDWTYFGRREFILCHCVMEAVLQSEVMVMGSRDPHLVSSLLYKLPPIMSQLSLRATDGFVSIQDVQNVVEEYNSSVLDCDKLYLNVSRLKKMSSNAQVHLIHLVALTPYYFSKQVLQ